MIRGYGAHTPLYDTVHSFLIRNFLHRLVCYYTWYRTIKKICGQAYWVTVSYVLLLIDLGNHRHCQKFSSVKQITIMQSLCIKR